MDEVGSLIFSVWSHVDSRIVEENGELELYGDHYMAKGQEIDGISTDQLASGIDSGTIFDTSAGFISTKHICNICGSDYYRSGDCSHVRGQTYENKECLVLADDGYIMENSENSIVFDGGYEGAGITRSSLSIKSQNAQNQEPIEYVLLSLDAKSLYGDERIFYFFSNKGGMAAFVAKQQTNDEVKTLAEGDGNMSDAQKQAELALQQAQSALGISNGILSQIRTIIGLSSDDGIIAKNHRADRSGERR
ncbi:hypothetical protein LOZ80_14395 [Paenibacillus sp. HWE-109]|uniref:hypothetical protein n=1 Tax=Paenibacillus sp. HWE-109 TaxID=1306526 RepID=UPI001EDF8FE1|nr:hypothetical protein [Paenibacillus sp. HWE-109]UKS30054.1 hypothetical protein LOZ80_14395 [Paenibacillus sp. HWE-109]